MSRAWAYAVGLTVMLAVAWPVTWPRHRDSFPLSPYPMFSRPLESSALRLSYAIGLDGTGTIQYLPPELVANDEVLQARATIARAVSSGRAGALCAAIAARAAADGDFAAIEEVRVVTGAHDGAALLRGDDAGEITVHARCPVERRR